jgi:hypothetical protein
MNSKLVSPLLSVLIAAAAASAQEKPDKPADKPAERTASPRRASIPLKLQIVYTRSLGEKKIGSTPYTLSVNADGRPSRLRMGVEVPIQVATVKDSAMVQTQYRNVGNNLDCAAEQLDFEERFRVFCTFEHSSVYSAEGRGSTSSVGDVSMGNNMPAFRSFKSEANVILRDGQTTQYTVATDPVSGEVLKIDVTLNVVR